MNKQYILHVWRGVEPKVVPVKGGVTKTIKRIAPCDEDIILLLEVNAKGIPRASAFSTAALEAAGLGI